MYIASNEFRLSKFIKKTNKKLSNALRMCYEFNDFIELEKNFKNLNKEDIKYICYLISNDNKLDAIKYISEKEGLSIMESLNIINIFF